MNIFIIIIEILVYLSGIINTVALLLYLKKSEIKISFKMKDEQKK